MKSWHMSEQKNFKISKLRPFGQSSKNKVYYGHFGLESFKATTATLFSQSVLEFLTLYVYTVPPIGPRSAS